MRACSRIVGGPWDLGRLPCQGGWLVLALGPGRGEVPAAGWPGPEAASEPAKVAAKDPANSCVYHPGKRFLGRLDN